MLMDVSKSQLLVIDVQERLLPAMADPEIVVEGCCRLLQAAATLAVPVTLSEQYPRGLGSTVPQVAGLVPPASILAKVHFACTADSAIMQRLQAADRPQVIIGGVEAHVCVLQTALALKERGFAPFVVVDAVSSRRRQSIEQAERRLAGLGVELVNSEMVLFEWLGQAGTEAFKAISPMLK